MYDVTIDVNNSLTPVVLDIDLMSNTGFSTDEEIDLITKGDEING